MVRILVVEDDRELNRVVCAFLRQQGFDAVGCLSANEAYDILYESSVALIISDIMMPNVDGFSFVNTVREMDKKFLFCL